MMKRFVFQLVLILLLVAPFGFGVYAQGEKETSPRFFEMLNDVPLMPGLEEILDRSMVFDKPEGRIVESVAAGEEGDLKGIRDFYSQTLPQLGWREISQDIYIREDEQLRMTLKQENGAGVVTFQLEPR